MASIKSHDIANYRPSASELRDYIKKFAPNSEIVVHQTWAYRVDDPRFTKPSEKPGEPATQEAMYTGLTSAYNTIARELGGLRIIPTGDAFTSQTTILNGASSRTLPSIQKPRSRANCPIRSTPCTWLAVEEGQGWQDHPGHGRSSREHRR